MTPIRLLNVILLIYVVGQSCAWEERPPAGARREPARSTGERRPTQVRRTRYTYRRPTTQRRYTTRRASSTRYVRRNTPVTQRRYRYSTRRTNTKTSSGKKPALFTRIMERIQNIRHTHDNKNQNKWSTRKSTVRRPTTRRTWSRKKAPVERPTTRRASSRVRETPPIERPPTRRVSTVRRVRYKRPIERVPTRRVRPVETVPKKVVSGKKPSLFHRIMNRVTEIRGDGGNTRTSKWKPKPVVTSKYTPRVSRWRPPTCLRKGCRMTSGVRSNHLDNYIKRAYRGKKDKLMKVVTWNIFEGKTPKQARRKEVCARLKLMEATVFGFQDASTQQIRAIERCLPRFHYKKLQGRGRYDYKMRRWMYNPIFYKTAHAASVTRVSDGYISATINRRPTPIATYLKVRFNTPTPAKKTTAKKNNINALWKRLNSIFNKVHSGHSVSKNSASTSKSATEVLIVNTNLITDKADEAESQIKQILRRLPGLSRYWKTPIILMGDFKFEDNSKVAKAIHDTRKFHNTFDKRVNRNSHPTITRFTQRYMPKDFVHHILESNLSPVFAATISDRLPSDSYKPITSKPVLTAFKMP